jgi:hypothetical protein
VAGGGLPGIGGGGLPGTGGGGLGGLPLADLLGGGLLGGGLLGGGPLGGGLADGRMPAMATGQESGLLGDNLPLLGGLLPISSVRTLPALSGMPAGGTAVPAADNPANYDPVTDPATDQAADPAGDLATADDARLHEEPADPEGKAGQRKFSGGRPVAGVDTEYR